MEVTKISSDFVTLNVGTGGKDMDSEAITFGSAPFTRLRERVVITGSSELEIARVLNSDPAGTEYGLVVRPIPNGTQGVGVPGSAVANYDTVSAVPDNTETPISSYIVPFGMTFYALGFVGSGDVSGKYILYLNGVAFLTSRTSVANPTANVDFRMATPTATAGQTVELRITHFATGVSGEFEGTILGYIL